MTFPYRTLFIPTTHLYLATLSDTLLELDHRSLFIPIVESDYVPSTTLALQLSLELVA